jgi:hypothetical protein
LTNTQSGQIGFTFTPPKEYGGFGFNGSLTSGKSWTTTTVDQTSYQKQFGYQSNVGVNNLAAKHAVLAVTTVDQLIPRLVDQDPWAQLRRPMDMIRQG